MRKAIVLLTFRPQASQVDFYRHFEGLGYEFFVMVDDNELDTSNWNARLLQIDDAVCAERGFKHFNPVIRKPSSAWDKALYYFSSVDCTYEHVWFIEHDVFLTSHDVLSGIDQTYPDADILSEGNEVNLHGNRDTQLWWWWPFVPDALPAPWAHSMVCAVRLSRTMLTAVDNLVKANGDALSDGWDGNWVTKCPFIEFVFHTLALHKGMKVVTPPEMRGVVWRKDWSPQELATEGFYHPVKDVESHPNLRQTVRTACEG